MSRKPGAPEQIALPLGSAPHPSSAAAQALMAFLLRLRARGVADVSVLRALETVPRELFAPHRFADLALRDIALPIPCGQIMPEPLFVARAMEALAVEPDSRVLEIGTGSGYVTALLSLLSAEVYSVERISQLLDKVRARLWKLRIHNLRVAHADGYLGLAEVAPFDGIIVAAAPPVVPPRLLEQLAPQGRLVIPVGTGERQQLKLIVRDGDRFTERMLEPVRFVPLLERLA